MEVKTISVKNLLGKQFNIPYYQRGYRWEEKQVNDLLNDLQEFYYKMKINKDKSKDASFYCMQPLVVVKNNNLTHDPDNPVYDLIDGQQRLTTIYLILKYLKKKDEDLGTLYTLSYERLPKEESEKLFEVGNLDDLNDDSKLLLSKYNDFFFLFRTYQTIKKWFAQTGHIKWQIMQTILLGDGSYDTNQQDVRFLWYEPDQEIKTEQDADVLRGSIDIFNRLNYGQTPLSNTDLIKAMLMICDIYSDDELPLRKEESSRYATEWDTMEKRLHNRLLWSMLVPAEYQPYSRMELLFDFVAHELFDNKKEEWESIAYANIAPDDNDFAYRVVSAYLLYSDQGIVSPDEYGNRVKYIWKEVQNVYHMFCNWYNDRRSYHLIGFYILLHDKLMGGGGKTSRYKIIKDLRKWYTSQSRKHFVEKITLEIGEKVKIKSVNKEDNSNKKTYQLCDINYEKTPDDLIRVLTLFNVDLTMNETAENPLFDFELFKKTKPISLEHIHPQNLKLEDKKVIEWYESRRNVLDAHDKIPHTTTTNLDELQLLQAITFLDTTLGKNSKSEQDKRECEKYLSVIDSFFDELANIGPDEMHTIRNMALVDGPVNSAFSNRLLDEKREIMYQKSKERSKEGQPTHYIMLGTRLVFNKIFTPKNDIIDMEFWGKKDREAYYSEIEKVYNKYVK